ncbi:MAG: response regulator, partial [Kiritimatiellaeota bacterium]|nr:response regulator [Kiritimatiellota bacterium]
PTLQQVLAKILECAIRETDKGTVVLDISSSRTDEQTALTRIEVSSTSVDLSKTLIFSSFDFAESELSSKDRRTKLELAVCQRIIEKMGGEFQLLPTTDEDSGKIVLGIPFQETPESRITEIAKERLTGKPSKSEQFKQTFNGISVLLAEDDPINQSLAVAFLSKLGGAIDTADNGKIAFDKFREKEYDIVLLDCEMPVMNGFEAAEAIREFEKESGKDRRVPIIAMTAYAARGDRENCLASGMDDHVPKPITLDLLASIAERHIFLNQ